MLRASAAPTFFSRQTNFMSVCILFSVKNKLTLSTISILTPMPGTGQFEIYKDRIITDDYRKWDFVHLTIEPTKMKAVTFYRKFYGLYVKIAFLILKNKLLSFRYLGSAIVASFEYWFEAFKGIWRKK